MGVIGDSLGTVGAVLISIMVSLFTNAGTGAIVLGVLSVGFLYYSLSIKDKLSANLARGVGGTLTFFALYNFFIWMLFFITPDSVALIFGIISLGTWNIIIALIFAALLDGVVVAQLTETLQKTGKLK